MRTWTSKRCVSERVIGFSAAVLTCGLAALAVAQDGWVTASPDGAGFRVRFPASFRHAHEDHSDADGLWVNHSYRASSPAGAYQVTMKDYARYDIAGVQIDAVLDATCRGAGLTVTAAPSATSRRCELSTGRESTRAEVYWSAPRIYVVTSVCSPSACDAAERDQFHRSFALHP